MGLIYRCQACFELVGVFGVIQETCASGDDQGRSVWQMRQSGEKGLQRGQCNFSPFDAAYTEDYGA